MKDDSFAEEYFCWNILVKKFLTRKTSYNCALFTPISFDLLAYQMSSFFRNSIDFQFSSKKVHELRSSQTGDLPCCEFRSAKAQWNGYARIFAYTSFQFESVRGSSNSLEQDLSRIANFGHFKLQVNHVEHQTYEIEIISLSGNSTVV